MKKIILIIIAIVLGVIVGYTIECSTIELATQKNISEEDTAKEIISENEKHEEHEDDEEHEHDHFMEIEGSAMKALTVQKVADLWEINADVLLLEIIAEFDLQGNYTVETILEEIRDAEYKFSPAIIKDLAEETKNQNAI
ncbi:MAG: hypothetical protein KAI67_02055 [Candidatus Pacebacteria bacterium]|nr:hypothetical protein [Candidatus Paceibacterota bacterium]